MGNEYSAFPYDFEDFSDCSSGDITASDVEEPTPDSQRQKLCSKLFESRERTGDVVFVVGKVPQRIPGHKAVLAAKSDVFDAQFYGAFGSPPEVDLTDDAEILPESFADFLRYVYLSDIDDCLEYQNVRNVVPMLYLSKKYLLKELTKECETFLDHFIDDSNFVTLLDDLGKHEEVDKVFWSFVDMETYAVLFSEGFQGLGVADMAAIIGRDSLGIREIDVFEAVVEWATVGLSKAGREDNRENVREFIGDAFYLIRFKQMHKDEFDEGPLKSGYLFDEEKTLFGQCSAGVLARFESSPRTGHVPVYYPPQRATTTPAASRSIVTRQSTSARLDPQRTVYLGNLPAATTGASLLTLLTDQFDFDGVSVSNYKLFPDRRFAFVELASRQLADEAVDALDGVPYMGRTLRCNFHRDRQ